MIEGKGKIFLSLVISEVIYIILDYLRAYMYLEASATSGIPYLNAKGNKILVSGLLLLHPVLNLLFSICFFPRQIIQSPFFHPLYISYKQNNDYC
jgi:hypothetical protein